MGLFNFRKKNTSGEVRQFYPLLNQIWGTGLFAPEKNLAVDNAVSLIANTISALPLRLYTYTKNGRQEAWWHPVAKLIRDPAVEESGVLFWKTIIRSMLCTGNGYIFLHRSKGEIVALEVIDPMLIRVERSESGRKRFVITGERGGVFSDHDVLQICYFGEGYTGSIGMSPARVHSATVKKNDLIAEYIAIFFQRGIGSRLLVDLDSDEFKPGSPKMDKLIQELNAYMNQWVYGTENAGRTIIAPPGTKISKLEMSNNMQGQVLELYQDSCNEVYRIFNVPAEIIDSRQSKYGSLEQKNADFLNRCIKPLCIHIAQTLAKGLLAPEDQANMFLEYDYTGLLETDPAKKAEYELKLFHGGMLTLNEFREVLGWGPVKDETEGETRWVPSNLVPLTAENIRAYLAKSKAIMGDTPSSATTMENKFNEHNGEAQDKLV